MTTRVPLRHPNTWIKLKASTKLLCISLTIFIHFQVPKKPVLLKWEDVRYWFLVFLIHAAGYMSAYPERSGPHQRVFNCRQAMVLSGQKSVYVVFLRNEKINLKVIILRFLSPGKKCWYHKIMKRPNFKIITVPNTISLNRPKCLIYHFISDPITHIWIFLNPQLFLCGFGFRPHVTVNPAYQSETVWIRSLEWKFSFNTLWIRNRVDANQYNYSPSPNGLWVRSDEGE